MVKTDSGYKFETSGRQFYANGYIGALIDYEGDVNIAHGYDGHIGINDENGETDYDNSDLTKEEQLELADYMISIWQKFKNQ